VNGTIDSNKITLVTGQNVLASDSFSTYNDFSNLNRHHPLRQTS